MLCCQTCESKEVTVLTVGGSSWICCGESVVRIGIGNEPPVAVRTLVVDKELLGYDLLLGLDVIRQLGGMAMSGICKVKFPQHETLICAAITLDGPDFHTEYDEGKRIWTASWKWSCDQLPVFLKNRLSEYPTPKLLQGEYKQELQAWIQNGCLILYPGDTLGPLKGLIPRMAIVQENKQKVRPVMDYREFNEHLTRIRSARTFEHTN